MEHRKRNQWQHKIEPSTLLKIAVTKRLIKQNKQQKNSLTSSLANQAMQYLKMSEVLGERMNTATKSVKQNAVAEIY